MFITFENKSYWVWRIKNCGNTPKTLFISKQNVSICPIYGLKHRRNAHQKALTDYY